VAYKGEHIVSTLRDARETAGISQRALSTRSGLTQSHISQIERGTLEPGLATLIDLARALDLELVLVPKRLLPAVNGLLHNTQAERDLSPESGNAALRDIARGERLVAKQKALYGGSVDLDRIADSLRFLRHAPLRSSDLAVVRNAMAKLNRYQASEQSRKEVTEIAATLQALRNRIAHGHLEGPRPAYALDEDDDA
jgi:transcriptional regulator with XRE-family HTH domain